MAGSLGVPSLLTWGAIAAALTVAYELSRKRTKTQPFPLPPGPAPLPIIGSALSIKTSEPWITYMEWRARYGDIFRVRVLNKEIIVISSEKMAKALLDRRSSIYSDRPYLATRLPYGWAFNFAWEPYGETWRLSRRMFHQVFRADAAAAFHPLQMQKARQLITDLIGTPADYPNHLQRFSAAVIMSIVYDYEIEPKHDHIVELFEQGNALALEDLTPERASIVETLPFVLSLPTWFPIMNFRRRAATSTECVERMTTEPFEYACKREADDTASPAMAVDLLRNAKAEGTPPQSLQMIKETCATAFVGGAETTTSTLNSFFFAMLKYPDVQKRAQVEIDEVVGTDRLPDFDDRRSLPYVEAVLRETLRMYPVAPLGLPHATTSDDVFEGYFIPKGSIVVANIWAIYHNEEIYPDANTFKPERFFVDGKLNDDISTSSMAYGFGRRICPGRHTADASLWAAMVSTLASVTISKALDEQGREIDVNPKFTRGVTSCPVPFPCSITPRRAGMNK